MASWTDGVLSIILDRSAEQLIGAVVLALALSAAFAAVGVRLLRSRRDETTRLTVVMLVLSLASMLVSGAFVRGQYDPRFAAPMPDEVSFGPGRSRPEPHHHPGRFAWMLDADLDGEVSPDEFRWAAAALGVEGRIPGPHFGPGGPGPDGPGPDGRPEGHSARELHDPPDEQGGGPSALVADDPPVATTEEHP